LAPSAKGAQTGGEKGGSFFLTGTVNSHSLERDRSAWNSGKKHQSLSWIEP